MRQASRAQWVKQTQLAIGVPEYKEAGTDGLPGGACCVREAIACGICLRLPTKLGGLPPVALPSPSVPVHWMSHGYSILSY